MREELKSLAYSEARRVQPVYARSGWRWCVRDGKTVEPYVPDVQDVEDHILRAMEELDSEDTDRSVSSGRLSCWRERSLGYLSFGVALNMESVDFEETAEDDEHWAFDPDYTVAPGRTLESWREEQGLSYREAATRDPFGGALRARPGHPEGVLWRGDGPVRHRLPRGARRGPHTRGGADHRGRRLPRRLRDDAQEPGGPRERRRGVLRDLLTGRRSSVTNPTAGELRYLK